MIKCLLNTNIETVLYLQDCIISDCGEIAPGEDDGFIKDDGSGDIYPEWPDDSGIDFENVMPIH